MNVLIVKTSSLGDIIHTLPALTDAAHHIPAIQFDWVVEEGFAEIPSWHSSVQQVIPIALRRWRKSIIQSLKNREWLVFLRSLRAKPYDMIIDAQGLIKSALITKMARGYRVGLDKSSLTEPFARFAYQKLLSVDLSQHAIWRMRKIFSAALDYPFCSDSPVYGIAGDRFQCPEITLKKPYCIFLHGTTWVSKRWPETHWIALAKRFKQAGYTVYMPWNNSSEYHFVERVSHQSNAVCILPRMNFSTMAGLLLKSKIVVSVDTGLAHLAAALEVPVFALYGPTHPARVGIVGQQAIPIDSHHPCVHCDKSSCSRGKNDAWSLCLCAISPETVWDHVKTTLGEH